MAFKMKVPVPALPDGVAVLGGSVATQVKPVVAPQAAPAVKELTQEGALTEELVQLWRLYEDHDMKKVTARIEALKKSLQSIANDEHEAGKPVVFEAPDGSTVLFGPRGTTSTVKDPMALVQHLSEKFSPEIAFSCVKIGLGELKKIMTEHELAEFVKEDDGARSLKAVVLKKEAA